MSDKTERKRIEIPEIVRVEGHAAVNVDIEGGKVKKVELDVFEGTRFFERLLAGHSMREVPHISSRVCAICSTGHVIAAIRAVERICDFTAGNVTSLFRELMHLGMIIESNVTHLYALALPDFLGFQDVYQFATEHQKEFGTWTNLRNLGAKIQTLVGGRPFHPVNLQVGGFSSYPRPQSLSEIKELLAAHRQEAIDTAQLLMTLEPPVRRTSEPVFLSLVPEGDHYGYFGDHVVSSEGLSAGIDEYTDYLKEEPVPHSHAKRSSAAGKPFMVGSLARLHFFHDRLTREAALLYGSSAMKRGDNNTIWNNLSQAIEVVEAFDRATAIIDTLTECRAEWQDAASLGKVEPVAGRAAGAVECPRGTLYHDYTLDDEGKVAKANMITPSAQNTYRIERDIQEVVSQALEKEEMADEELSRNLETLVRAYDPCNTCATHMVKVRRVNQSRG